MGLKEIHLQIDFRSETPIYLQIVEQIREKLAGGELRPGDQLPTVRQMAADLRVNWNTVARAYRLLDEAGLISTQQGRGTYIWEAPGEQAMQRLRREALQELSQRFVAQARRLGFSSAEILESIHQALQQENE